MTSPGTSRASSAARVAVVPVGVLVGARLGSSSATSHLVNAGVVLAASVSVAVCQAAVRNSATSSGDSCRSWRGGAPDAAKAAAHAGSR